MGLPSNWRSPAVSEDFAHHDYADFAQEFLRRNPEYQADFKVVQGPPAPADPPDLRDAIATKWGLVFRLRSGTQPTYRSGPLAPGRRALCPHPGAIAPDIGSITVTRMPAADLGWRAVA